MSLLLDVLGEEHECCVTLVRIIPFGLFAPSDLMRCWYIAFEGE